MSQVNEGRSNLRSALLLDRDGVLNEEVNYLHDPKDLVMIADVGRVVAACNQRGIPVVVVTNQAGIGRGYYDVAAYESVNRAMAEHLSKEDAHVDAWYHCPHHPTFGCTCRKPAPGMLERGASELGLDLSRSVMVGDKKSDLLAARAVGARAILVRTGYGKGEEQSLLETGRHGLFDLAVDSLCDAEPQILAWLQASQ
jgi:D-glycero-D-manno-heptose 1,7-bisphosphate phosphatase